MITYREARSSDNNGLLRLTRASGMSGRIGLRTERDPDFFRIMALRGPSSVFIALDKGQVVGSICVSQSTVFLGANLRPLHYISDFKVHPEYRRQGIGFKLTSLVVDFLVANDADLALLHVAKGNSRPFVFFSDRAHYPDFENIGTFHVYQFPARNLSAVDALQVKEISPDPEAIAFLNRFYSNYELARQVTASELEHCRLFAIQFGGELKGLLGLVDTSAEKRHVVHSLPRFFRMVLRLVNALRPLTRTARMPLPGEPIRMAYIRYLAVSEPSREIIGALIRNVRRIAYKEGFAFLSLGLHERDPLARYLPGRFPIAFRSTGMLVSMNRDKAAMERVHAGVPFSDFTCI